MDKSGVALKYTGGEVCNATGERRTFTINAMCDKNVTVGDYDVMVSGTECDPYVYLVS